MNDGSHEPVMGMDQRAELVGLPERESVVPAAAAARQVDVLGLFRLVVLGTRFEVRMLQDAHLFQQGQRPVDRRGVDAGHLALDRAGHLRRRDVALRAHHLGDDRPPLGGHAQPVLAQPGHDRREVARGSFHGTRL